MDYVRTSPPERAPELLQIVIGNSAYAFSFIHGSKREEHLPRPLRGVTEHAHDVYHIVLYADGDGSFVLAGAPRRARRGTLVLCSPGESHFFGSCGPGRLCYAEITFALEHPQGDLTLPFHELLARYAGRDLPAVAMPVELDPKQTGRLLTRMDLLLDRLMARPQAPGLEAYIAMLDLLAAVTDAVWPLPMSVPGPLLRARAEIEQRYRERLTVDDLAALANMSRGYFCRAFRREFGLAPIAYQLALRIRAAENLLRTTDLRCKEIAARVGFGDEYQFSKAFRKTTGTAPGAFRHGLG